MAENMFWLNGNQVKFKPGQTILEAAEEFGVVIPTLCHLKGATPTGACRICIVEVEGARNLPPSCSTPVTSGMKVLTESPKVVEARKTILELMLSSGNHNCAAVSPENWTEFQCHVQKEDNTSELCPVWGDCKLQDLAFQYQVKSDRFAPNKTKYPVETVSPMIVRDFSRCILCGRCVQACNEVQVNRAISFGYRGANSKIVASGDRPLMSSDCVFCGECIQACPVGALVEKKARYTWRPLLHVQDGKIIKVTGVEDAEPNQGRLCVKGRFGYDFIYSEDRLKTPLIRENGSFREASWDEALDLVADKIKEVIKTSGPDAL
ncbi:MAG: 2Fe-2S iron-sulfur cluster-binding protein, partial [Desulfobacterales bacterium]|nr:2Fe-2S iron-sulfur cluster-binding protein [Desulfobacterales bacterium]